MQVTCGGRLNAYSCEDSPGFTPGSLLSSPSGSTIGTGGPLRCALLCVKARTEDFANVWALRLSGRFRLDAEGMDGTGQFLGQYGVHASLARHAVETFEGV